MTSLSEAKHPHEVTLDWLKTVFERIEYNVEKNEKGNSLVAKHKDRANFIIDLRSDLGVIALRSVWGGKKLGWGKKADMFKAINKANAMSWLGILALQ